MKTITVKTLREIQQANPKLQLIDVRTPEEFAQARVGLAVNMPLDQLDIQTIRQQAEASDEPVYLICKMGGRSENACQQLIQAGVENVINVEGGTLAWIESGFSVDTGK